MTSGGTSEPTISIVLIVYNGGAFLQEAIDSVRRQSSGDWELVIVDDGSTDGSLERAAAAMKDDPQRIAVVRHEDGANRGMSASRNLGVASSRGGWVGFLDADDVLDEAWAERRRELIAEHGTKVDVIFSPCERWRSWSGSDQRDRADTVQRFAFKLNRAIEPPKVLEGLIRLPKRTPIGLVLKREAFVAVGGYEEEFTGMFEDQAFMTKLFLEHRAWADGRTLYRYRQHGQSAVSLAFASGARASARERFLDWAEDYVRKTQPDERTVLRTIRKARRQLAADIAWPLAPRLRAFGERLRGGAW